MIYGFFEGVKDGTMKNFHGRDGRKADRYEVSKTRNGVIYDRIHEQQSLAQRTLTYLYVPGFNLAVIYQYNQTAHLIAAKTS